MQPSFERIPESLEVQAVSFFNGFLGKEYKKLSQFEGECFRNGDKNYAITKLEINPSSHNDSEVIISLDIPFGSRDSSIYWSFKTRQISDISWQDSHQSRENIISINSFLPV